jgi:membrane-associated phospholipid phosphatase
LRYFASRITGFSQKEPGGTVTYSFLFDLVIRSPVSSMDHLVAGWFHLHLAQPFIDLMLGFSALASPIWVGTLTCGTLLFSVLKRWWYASLAVILTIPAGTLLGEGIKILVHRERPFHESPFLDLTGYSFPSGHTISATLLYGLLAVFAILLFKSLRWRVVAAISALSTVFLVGLSRIALGAHYLTDVLGAIVAGIVWLTVCLLAVQRLRRTKLRVGRAVAAQESSGATGQ